MCLSSFLSCPRPNPPTSFTFFRFSTTWIIKNAAIPATVLACLQAPSFMKHFVSAVQCHFWRIWKLVFNVLFVAPWTRANIFVAEKLPQKICSCGCGFKVPNGPVREMTKLKVFWRTWEQDVKCVPTNSVLGKFGHFALVEFELLRDHSYSCVIVVLKQWWIVWNVSRLLPLLQREFCRRGCPRSLFSIFCSLMKRCVQVYDCCESGITETRVALVYYLHTCDLILIF